MIRDRTDEMNYMSYLKMKMTINIDYKHSLTHSFNRIYHRALSLIQSLTSIVVVTVWRHGGFVFYLNIFNIFMDF